MRVFAVVTPEPAEAGSCPWTFLGYRFEQADGEYFQSERIAATRPFGLAASQAPACLARPSGPARRPVPQATVEFEVESPSAVTEAAAELEARGHTLLHPARTDPGATVARILSPEGLIVGVSYAPWLHDDGRDTAQ